MRIVVTLTIALGVTATFADRTYAQPADVVDIDVDGDGDVDADDRAILHDAEQINVEDKSEATALAESARAVTVVDLARARERSSDLGEVLARTHGIAVRRTGGLGSTARLSLNGLNDEQIRLFLDGIPLELAGWGLGLANIPVNLIQRADVYRGVVPIALGADALGGAIDLVTDPSWVNRASLSYEVGSFGTHRTSFGVRAHDSATGLALGVSAFLDRSRNNYPIDVEVADDKGHPIPRTVRRFHDGYTAGGTIVEAGIVDRGPVTRAVVRGFRVQYTKELQHNAVMTVPFGEAEYGGTARGVATDVAVEHAGWRARIVGGLTYDTTYFHDLAMKVYNWLGEAVRDRLEPGETGGDPTDQQIGETTVFARVTVERSLGAHQRLRLAAAPTRSHRSGRDFLDPNPAGRDPIEGRRDLLSLVVGGEHDLIAQDARLHNIAFAKYYRFASEAEDPRPQFTFAVLKSTIDRFGIGDSARYELSRGVLVKASYEWATRLPSPDELFGDGVLVVQNLGLKPEISHNVNVGAQLDRGTARGTWVGEVAGFARLVENLIVPLGTNRTTSYYNVFGARIIGIEGAAGWDAPGKWASLRMNVTLQDIRNSSDQGAFGSFDGDRIPNRPWLLGSLEGALRRRDNLRRGDEVSLFASSRYVHEYLRGWESAGLPEFKQKVDSQLVHGAGVSYALRGTSAVVTTLELQNLTDARVFDTFGAQRPGRAAFLKISGEL